MEAMNYLPPWAVDYTYNVSPSQRRTEDRGFKRQAKKSHRNVVIANATRMLRLSEIHYFEYFVRELLNDGNDKFTDDYADANGTVTGTVRIVGGQYSVSSDSRLHIVTCELEIFR